MTFPLVFPFVFGGGHNWSADASLAVSAGTAVSANRSVFANASLAVDSFAETFPYTFPIIFDMGTDSVIRGQPLSAGLTVTANRTGAVTRGRHADVSQPVTVALIASALSGGDHLADVSLTISANRSVAVSRHQSLSAFQGLVATMTGTMRRDAHFQANLPVQASTPASTKMAANISAHQAITTGLPSHMALHALAGANLSTVATIASTSTRGHPVNAAPLVISAGTTASANRDAIIDAHLTIRTILEATMPQPTGFWPFYIK